MSLNSKLIDDAYIDNFKASSFLNVVMRNLGVSMENNDDLAMIPVRHTEDDHYELTDSERRYIDRNSIHGSFLTADNQKRLPVFLSKSFAEYISLVEPTFDTERLETPAERGFRQIMHWAFSAPIPNGLDTLVEACSESSETKADIVILSAQRRYLKTFAALLLCNMLPHSIYYANTTKRSNNELTVCCLTGVQYLKYLTSVLYYQLRLLDDIVSSTTWFPLASSLSVMMPMTKVLENTNINLTTTEEDDCDDSTTKSVEFKSLYIFSVVPLDIYMEEKHIGLVAPGKRSCSWLCQYRENGKTYLKADFRKMENTLITSLQASHTSCNIKGDSFFMNNLECYPYNVPICGPVSMGPLTLDVSEDFIFPKGNKVKHRSTKRTNAIFIRTIQICEGHLPVAERKFKDVNNLLIHPVIQLTTTIARLQFVVHTLPKIYNFLKESL